MPNVIYTTQDGEVFKSLRNSVNMTQGALATTLNVSINTVSRWERDALPVPQYAVAYLAAILALRNLCAAANAALENASIPSPERRRLDAALEHARALL